MTFEDSANSLHCRPPFPLTVNLALALSSVSSKVTGTEAKPRVGLLDLDIFGPSIPKLMGLEGVGEPYLTPRTCQLLSYSLSHLHEA